MGVFAVSKKGQKQRLILDCRRVNRRFRPPPGVDLGSLESLAQVEIPEGATLYGAQGDIKDCFHECGMPEATSLAAILRIHLERMRDSGRLALDGGRAVLLPGDGYRIVAQPRLSVRALCVSGARAGRGQPRCGQGAASDPR